MMRGKRIWIALLAALCLTGSAFAQLSAPTALTIYSDGTSVELNWAPVAGATQYNVYKDVTPAVDFSFPHAVVSTNSYSDGVAGGLKYFYAVTAVIPTGCISGTVTDENSLALELVSISGTLQSNPAEGFCAKTLSNGTFNVCDLTVGTYDVVVYMEYRPVSSYTVVVTDGMTTVQNHQFAATVPVPVVGHLTANTSWTNNNVYQLTGAVEVDSLVTLTIEEGTTIIGNYPTVSLLIVRRGGMIHAVGTECLPIVMTSNRPVGQRANGDWGGLVINGNAHNNRGEVPNGEGDSGPHGRADNSYDTESSGTLRYIRLEFPGFRFTPTNELNGLCLQSVGSGTDISYVQVAQGQDDGVEFFGGTVSVHHMILADGGDDGFDWTDGWQGSAHHVLIHQRGAASDRCIEADNLETNHNALPRAHANLSNFTMIGKQGNSATDGDDMMTIRRGTEMNLFNSIVTLAKRTAFDLDDIATSQNAASGPATPNGNLTFDYSVFWDNGGSASEVIDPATGAGIGDGHFLMESAEYDQANCTVTANYPVNTIHIAAPTGWVQDEGVSNFMGCGFVGTNATNRIADPLLVNPAGYPGFDAHPAAGSPVYSGAAPSLPAGLPVVPYLGVYSSPTDNWTSGWTNFPAN